MGSSSSKHAKRDSKDKSSPYTSQLHEILRGPDTGGPHDPRDEALRLANLRQTLHAHGAAYLSSSPPGYGPPRLPKSRSLHNPHPRVAQFEGYMRNFAATYDPNEFGGLPPASATPSPPHRHDEPIDPNALRVGMIGRAKFYYRGPPAADGKCGKDQAQKSHSLLPDPVTSQGPSKKSRNGPTSHASNRASTSSCGQSSSSAGSRRSFRDV